MAMIPGVASGIPAAHRPALRALLECGAAAELLAPPAPPDYLAGLFELAEARFGVPADVLAAVAWVMTRYGADEALEPLGGRLGVMGVPAAARGASGELGPNVAAAAAYLGGLWTTAADGPAGALLTYCGTAELAGRVFGAALVLFARRVDPERLRSLAGML